MQRIPSECRQGFFEKDPAVEQAHLRLADYAQPQAFVTQGLLHAIIALCKPPKSMGKVGFGEGAFLGMGGRVF